jgi:hypothetical protein
MRVRAQPSDMWRQVGDCIALLDVLVSLRTFAKVEQTRGALCQPSFIDRTCRLLWAQRQIRTQTSVSLISLCADALSGPVLDLKDNWHVCVDLAARSFVPNNIALGLCRSFL